MKPRKYPPLKSDHPFVRGPQQCAGCGQPFEAGDVTTLVMIGPGGSEESRKRAREGRAYNAIARPAHYACVTGEES